MKMLKDIWCVLFHIFNHSITHTDWVLWQYVWKCDKCGRISHTQVDR